MPQQPGVDSEQQMAAGKFLSLKVLEWTDSQAVTRTWESAERVNFSGAVLIIPVMKPSNRIVLIRQFRPPARAEVIEFPAGLINRGETPHNAALRELREETGYAARIVSLRPPAYTTPGMSDESVHMAWAEIDEELPENRKPQTAFDPAEMIETLFVDLSRLSRFYAEETQKGTIFDAKLAAFILALEYQPAIQ